MKNDDFEEKTTESGDFQDYGPLTGADPKDKEADDEPEVDEDDVSMYYPDGDGEHMEEDDGAADPFREKQEKKKEKIRKKNGRLTGGQIALIAVVFVLYTAVIVAASWILFYRPSQAKTGGNDVPFDINPVAAADGTNAPPVHKAGESGDKEAPGAETDGQGEEVPPPVDEGEAAEGTEVQTATSEWKAIEGIYNVLVVGMDKQANLADVTMLVNINTVENSITVMQIPRDTLITTGVATDKINAQYASLVGSWYHQGYDNCYMRALSDYARIQEQSLCVKIHFTVLVDLEGFPAIVNSVGPIRVFVPGPMFYEDPAQGLSIAIGEGWQDLDGYAAEGFVRFRSDYVQGDLGRVNAQKIFMTALYQKVVSLLKNMDIGRINDLAQVVKANVTTDMSISDLVFFARSFLNIGTSNVTMMTIPGNMEAWNVHYVINRAATLQVINDHFNIYEKAIDDNIFDRYWTFCYNYENYLKVYYAPVTSAYTSEYTADEVAEDSIAIPFIH